MSFRVKSKEKIERRLNQRVISRELKLNTSSISKTKLNKLYYMFVQAKWITNDMIGCENIMEYKYNEHKTIKHYDKDKNEIYSTIDMPSTIHQALCEKVQEDIKSLSKKKKKEKVGKLKFKSDCNMLPIKTGMFHIENSKRVSIPGFARKNSLRVRGIDNVPDGAEIATGCLIKKASGLYLKITCYVEKEKKEIKKEIGIDFGIKNTITTSEGKVYNCQVGESERLKRLSRKLNRSTKGSNNRRKVNKLLQKEYEHIENKRNDEGNKIYHELSKDAFVYYQDDNFNGWKAFNMGRKVQYGVLGRVKHHLGNSEYALDVKRFQATTKVCSVCGLVKKEKLGLDVRTFVCSCGAVLDRDVNAARVIKLLGQHDRLEAGTALDLDNHLCGISNNSVSVVA